MATYNFSLDFENTTRNDVGNNGDIWTLSLAGDNEATVTLIDTADPRTGDNNSTVSIDVVSTNDTEFAIFENTSSTFTNVSFYVKSDTGGSNDLLFELRNSGSLVTSSLITTITTTYQQITLSGVGNQVYVVRKNALGGDIAYYFDDFTYDTTNFIGLEERILNSTNDHAWTGTMVSAGTFSYNNTDDPRTGTNAAFFDMSSGAAVDDVIGSLKNDGTTFTNTVFYVKPFYYGYATSPSNVVFQLRNNGMPVDTTSTITFTDGDPYTQVTLTGTGDEIVIIAKDTNQAAYYIDDISYDEVGAGGGGDPYVKPLIGNVYALHKH